MKLLADQFRLLLDDKEKSEAATPVPYSAHERGPTATRTIGKQQKLTNIKAQKGNRREPTGRPSSSYVCSETRVRANIQNQKNQVGNTTISGGRA